MATYLSQKFRPLEKPLVSYQTGGTSPRGQAHAAACQKGPATCPESIRPNASARKNNSAAATRGRAQSATHARCYGGPIPALRHGQRFFPNNTGARIGSPEAIQGPRSDPAVLPRDALPRARRGGDGAAAPIRSKPSLPPNREYALWPHIYHKNFDPQKNPWPHSRQAARSPADRRTRQPAGRVQQHVQRPSGQLHRLEKKIRRQLREGARRAPRTRAATGVRPPLRATAGDFFPTIRGPEKGHPKPSRDSAWSPRCRPRAQRGGWGGSAHSVQSGTFPR